MLSAKPWRVEAILRLGIRLMACFAFGMATIQLLTFFLPPSESLDAKQFQMVMGTAVGILSFQGALIGLSVVFFKEHGMGWRDAVGWNGPKVSLSVVLGIVVGLVSLPVMWKMVEASNQLMKSVQMEPTPQLAVQTMQTPMPFWLDGFLAVATVFIAPLAEEILFRGIIYPKIKQLGYPLLAFFGTSLLFSLTHFDLPTALPLFFLSLILILLYEKTDNLLAPTVAHCVFNAANVVLLKLGTS